MRKGRKPFSVPLDLVNSVSLETVGFFIKDKGCSALVTKHAESAVGTLKLQCAHTHTKGISFPLRFLLSGCIYS